MANGEWASEEASLKPYDKGYKRRSDRGFGLYTEGENGPKSPFWRPDGHQTEATQAD